MYPPPFPLPVIRILVKALIVILNYGCRTLVQFKGAGFRIQCPFQSATWIRTRTIHFKLGLNLRRAKTAPLNYTRVRHPKYHPMAADCSASHNEV
jgi:hypothetical protein